MPSQNPSWPPSAAVIDSVAPPGGCLDDDVVLRFLRGAMPPSELAAVEGHVDECANCRTLLSSLALGDAGGSISSSTSDGATEPGPVDAGVILSDRFVLGELVGAGGMGRVFRGLDQTSRETVAIKLTAARDAEELDRFARERRLLASLRDPAIVRYIAEGHRDDGSPYLVMEWLDGEDLASRLRRGCLPVEQTITLGVRVAKALSAAHAVGVVHRDIKPSNVFLRKMEVDLATVIDFGVARPGWHQPSSLATRTGALLGTLGYMAPEQAVGARTADARADVFSLGCVLYECLTGQRLFRGAHAVEVLANLLTQPVKHPRAITPDVPEALDALVVRMVSRDPKARPADCDAVVVALEHLAVRPAVRAWWRGLALISATGLLVAAAALMRARPTPAESVHVATVLPEAAEVTTLAEPAVGPPTASASETGEPAPAPAPVRVAPRPAPVRTAGARPFDTNPSESEAFGAFRN